MQTYKYRPDIDGLRAIAVLSVVGFHAFPHFFKGGFIGVDIFFVISGFLISKIIFDQLAQGSFSFKDFYIRRIKRIFPALIFVLLIMYAIGWVFLLNDEYKQLGKHIAAGATFSSNFILRQEAGYFNANSSTTPLLHLWSLGIEEQFYIVWPFLIWFAFKKQFNILIICLTLVIISFTLNVLNVGDHDIAVFYSPVTRVWELLLGSLWAYQLTYSNSRITIFDSLRAKLVATNKLARWQDMQAMVGLILLLSLIFLLNDKHPFPGWWALLPTLGAFLIIAAGPNAWVNRTILSHKVLVWFGLISFPLYLWHWPLISFTHLMMEVKLTKLIRISLVLISIFLAWLTYRVIEKPLRFHKNNNVAAGLCITLALLGTIGYSTYKNNGFNFRLKDRAEFLNFFENNLPQLQYLVNHEILQKYRVECDFYPKSKAKDKSFAKELIASSCYTPATDKSIFIWGDSHAQQLYYGLASVLPKDISILQVASSACSPRLISNVSSKRYCYNSNRFAWNIIKKTKPDIVILAQAYGHEHNKDLPLISAELKKLGIPRVLILGPVPQWKPDLYKVIAKKFWLHSPKRINANLSLSALKTDKRMKEKYAHSSDIEYISLLDFFCTKEGCLTYLGKDRKEGLITFDYGHLTPRASTYLAKRLLAPIVVNQIYKKQHAANIS
ncbi:O-antigen acetylase [Legionella beliardensis]|uniref:O-antigen acetylase n=1 Tax=Legionella beliardensis TaxID=91822 RepID=A0A378HY44_9GAMM|nr:acyltransferase family protein [Legionella beliardensis]STX27722.1 O-antigen acetylase [Legionella beliardensis]